MRPALSLILTLSLALSLGLAGVAPAGAASDHAFFRWQVVAIKDGDTLAVELPGLPTQLNPVAVRVRSVDAPESGGRAKCPAERALANRVTEFTRRAIAAAATIEFERPTWDKYGGRIDADVWVDGALLSGQLIAAGLAR
ncbi:MAG TPA: thermonuclease family protein, partial [Dongiaceae bacterium]